MAIDDGRVCSYFAPHLKVFFKNMGTFLDLTGIWRMWTATRDPGYPEINRKHDKCRLRLRTGSL